MRPLARRPPLSPELYRPSLIGTASYLVFAVILFLGPAYANYRIAICGLRFLAKGLAMIPLTYLAAYGINMMGFVGHEGTHLSLVPNRKLSLYIGLVYASAVLTYLEFGFALSHWNHHRYTNREGDPDIPPVDRLTIWWQRLLFSRPIYNWRYLRQAWGVARGRKSPFRYPLPFPHRDQVWMARWNFVFAALWTAAYGAIFYGNFRLGIFAIALPMITVNFIGACQTYIDHAGLEDRVFRNAYSRTSLLNTILYFGANFHAEHHAYPGVPCYRLPRVHRLLVAQGIYPADSSNIVGGYLAGFKALNRPYRFGRKSADFDAFERAATRGDEHAV
jgi:fatty acid desaturase